MEELSVQVRERYLDMYQDMVGDGGPDFERAFGQNVENIIHQLYQNYEAPSEVEEEPVDQPRRSR